MITGLLEQWIEYDRYADRVNPYWFHHFCSGDVNSINGCVDHQHGWIPDEYLFDCAVTRALDKDILLENKQRMVELRVNPRSLIVEITLERPISDQIKLIKKVANMQQKQLKEWGIIKQGRNEADRWVGYLRLLDALEAGASFDDIHKTLFPHLSNEDPDYYARKTFNNWKLAAERIRDSDYLSIASL